MEVLIVLIVLGAIGALLFFVKKGTQNQRDKETHQEINKIWERKLDVVFTLTGWNHLEGEAALIQRNVEVGDLLNLEAIEGNKYDNLAIAVKKDGYQIGWYGKDSPKKRDVYILVYSKKRIKAEVIHTFPTEVRVLYNPGEQTDDNTIPFE